MTRALTRDVARGSVTAFAIYLLGAMFAFLSQILVARLTGAEGYGLYAYVFAWMTVLARMSALGFEVSLLRTVASYDIQGQWALLRGVVRYAERRSLATGLSIAGVGMGSILLLSGRLPPALVRTFLFGFPLVPLWALLWLRVSSMRAFGAVVLALAPDRLVREGMVLLLLPLAALAGRTTAPVAMLATVVGAAVGLAIVTLALRRQRPAPLATVRPEYRAAEWRLAVVPLLALAVSEVVMNRTGVLFLGWFGHTKDAGILALAFNLASLVALPRIAVNATFAPMISRLYTSADGVALQGMVTRTALWTLGGAIAIALAIAVMTGPFLEWFGRDFQGGLRIVWILLIGQVAVAAGGSQQFLMTMTGNERGAAMILVSCTLANIVVTPICILLAGSAGAAIAMTIALCGWQIAMAFYVRRRLGLLPGILGQLRPQLAARARLALNDDG
jgi:O-antigen/teichoic acid export membrane protein